MDTFRKAWEALAPHFQEPDAQQAARRIEELVCRRLPRHFGVDPVRDIQVLSPMHRGPLGCQNLNQLLRRGLNPRAEGSQEFQVGDKVMQVRNNYELEVFNGDLGFVLETGEDSCLVSMGERVLEYGPLDLEDLVLAYAVTVHKSQGSEYPVVVMALGTEHFVMLNRPLLYTGVTRGKRLVVLVGSRRALGRAVATADPTRRHAGLDRKLSQYLDDDK